MDTHSPTLLCESNDMLFNILPSCHHQVGHFVSQDDNEGELLRHLGPSFVVAGLQPFTQFLFAELVVDADVAHPGGCEQ